jgi:hypothetical protein
MLLLLLLSVVLQQYKPCFIWLHVRTPPVVQVVLQVAIANAKHELLQELLVVVCAQLDQKNSIETISIVHNTALPCCCSDKL